MNSKYAPTKDSEPWQKWAYLEEELGELQAAMGKSRRWGMDSANPELPKEKQVKNAEWMLSEMQDVKHAIALMEEHLTAEGYVAKGPIK